MRMTRLLLMLVSVVMSVLISLSMGIAESEGGRDERLILPM